ncbi:MAG: phosphopentomutase [Thermosediminibacterales bacterium]|nr:phosphopentomutase [Thermosediminibacterales bacterium]
MIKRIILIVMDSVGIGELPDAANYNDVGSNTLGNVAKAVGGLNMPNFKSLGLGNISVIKGVNPVKKPKAAYGKMAEISAGKDTTTGHWEMMGLISKDPFPTYPNGFPEDLINKFEKKIGRKTLGNKVASGTVIINELGQEHIKTGYPIIYTSADSVFQIAAHEDIIPVEELYQICKTAREMLKGPHAVARVIARPFVGEPGNFVRTDRRKDFSLEPHEKTVLDYAKEKGYRVVGVGKINDIFAGRGLTDAVHTDGNNDGIDKTLSFLQKDFEGIIFTNLVDFDMLYGHRNDPLGYAKALEELDKRIMEVIHNLKDSDLLIITADHGCDPTTESTDHSREYTPLLIYNHEIKAVNLGIRETFADIGATICDLLDLGHLAIGSSMKNLILK